ncbi:helix-turn-helix transcriptional regulator [Anatilimnocola floriformis]|uniref:helix-turn-helix transcriptional regulator n=1 Tax=Anatilimnocola floriformis TaxID=2948575 RepID=UPI0036F1BEED
MSTVALESHNSHPNDRLVTVEYVAGKLAVSTRSVWRLVSARKIVLPIKVGGATRWREAEITRWMAAGCPPLSGE